MIKVDPRVIPAEKIDRSRTVLVDTHSLSAGNRLLERASVPAFDVSSFADDAGHALANIIQSLVLYDTIVVDSILLEEAIKQFVDLDTFTLQENLIRLVAKGFSPSTTGSQSARAVRQRRRTR